MLLNIIKAENGYIVTVPTDGGFFNMFKREQPKRYVCTTKESMLAQVGMLVG